MSTVRDVRLDAPSTHITLPTPQHTVSPPEEENISDFDVNRPFCRFCMSNSDRQGPLYQVCSCNSHTHISCLQEWVRARPSTSSPLVCEVCLQNYSIDTVELGCCHGGCPDFDTATVTANIAMCILILVFISIIVFAVWQAIVADGIVSVVVWVMVGCIGATFLIMTISASIPVFGDCSAKIQQAKYDLRPEIRAIQ
ncbi:hypothetical protein PCE1_002642 [Barthelona sp. PCE]